MRHGNVLFSSIRYGGNMNEKLKALAQQAKPSPNLIWEDAELERFAELVRQDEREACAALCTEMGNKQSNQCFYDPWDCASSIRARGNHD